MAFRTFVSGLGEYLDFGNVGVDNDEDDPNFLEDQGLTCYHDYGQREPVFPFHDCCFELLEKCLFWPSEHGSVDNDLLYSIMEKLATDRCRLEVDYGITSQVDFQCWESCPGYEYLVVHPTEDRGLKQIVSEVLVTSNFAPVPSKLDLGHRLGYDPFSKLPYELLLKVLNTLSTRSILSLANASWSVHSVLRENDGFWKQRIRSSIPWFFELHEVFGAGDSLRSQDPKRLCLWVEKISRRKKYIRGPFSKQRSDSFASISWKGGHFLQSFQTQATVKSGVPLEIFSCLLTIISQISLHHPSGTCQPSENLGCLPATR